MLDLEQYQIAGTTAKTIASSAEAAIRDGRIETGEPLPTVRALAAALGTSPATVNAAYRILRQRGLVIGEGRRGTRVAPRPALRTPERSTRWAPPAHRAGLPGADRHAAAVSPAAVSLAAASPAVVPPAVRDLTYGLPDPALLPPLAPVLARLDLEPKLRISSLEADDSELLSLAAAAFRADGLPAEALAVVSGAFDGVDRVLQAHLRPGDRVIVEDPAYISTLDLLLALGLIPVPVPVDASGLLAEPLEAALARGAEAVIVVPRAQNPTGAALDAKRMAELQRVLAEHPEVLLVEDDHASAVSGAPFSTLHTAAIQRWAVIRATSKHLHPDLRLALVTGDEATIARVDGRRALGPRWVSHVLQAIVAELMRDPRGEEISARAAEAYAQRRAALTSALADRGIDCHGRSGLNVWVPVREEAPVVRALLDAGWLVAAGERFRINTPPGIRITVAPLQQGEAERIADVIADVEHAGRRRSSY